MYLRAHTFFPALFVSLLFVASTFAIPITISPDSNSHDFLSDAQSPKLVDRDVVPKSIHARAKVPNRLPGSLVFPTKAIEAQVIFLGQQLSEQELTALISAIETMLKPAMKFFNGVLKICINEANEYEKVRLLLGCQIAGDITPRLDILFTNQIEWITFPSLNDTISEIVSFKDGKAKVIEYLNEDDDSEAKRLEERSNESRT
ncbi:hypothetical protein GGU10DRAFT_413375 [Lentinula aff. detonsa]|uniref:Uncharacterized protein n=1 Tax=Lentinula aff. detonsa TaxID=2804958 RepID=A0AA38KDJ9_9AGAR|nr:hypothetical protein GGU10DRAFT_413375 [Lentinula aff. detonsa]